MSADNPRHRLFQALEELDNEVGEVPGLGRRSVRVNAVISVVNQLFPKPPPKDELERIEALAILLFKMDVESEEDWPDNEPVTDEHWMSLQIEVERERYRHKARQMIKLVENTSKIPKELMDRATDIVKTIREQRTEEDDG